MKAHQRSKLERYGDTLFCVLRPARYIDETETVEFDEVHVFAGPQFVVTVRHGEAPGLAEVRAALEARPHLLRRGPVAILHAIVDRVVDDYAPVVAGVEHDIDEIEDEVFDGSADASRRVYELTREVIDFQRATKPLIPILEHLMADQGVGEEEGRYVRDVLDHALRVQEQVDGFRQLLQSILNVNLTLETKALSEASIRQNEEVKKISAWAAILFAPSVIGTDLRHELPAHARAALALRVPVRARADGRGLGGVVPGLQAPRWIYGRYRLDMGSRWSLRSSNSILSIASEGSILSIGSVGSVGSIASIGSAWSVLSIGSAGSAASALSFASRRSILASCSADSIRGRPAGRAPRLAVGLVLVVLGLAFLSR